MKQLTMFEGVRLDLPGALSLTVDSLRVHASAYRHWCLAYSGGKDSTATLTAVDYLLRTGQVPAPETVSVLYCDTRMELPPLHANALAVLERCRQQGWHAEQVLPALDDRFFVYMFGRGVPPPSNTFRWCTEQLKIEPIGEAVHRLAGRLGDRPLLLLGLRLGESAARDARIAIGCGRNGGECGQGWFQERPPAEAADTLAPLLHWRTCHVWEWLTDGGADVPDHGWFEEGSAVAQVYGGSGDHERAVEEAARTGCVGCNLASKDFSLARLMRQQRWSYLVPLARLKPLYAALEEPQHRLRKDGSEKRADGSMVSNPCRLGPLTFDARLWGLQEVLAIQAQVNAGARAQGAPDYVLIDAEEEARIRELIAARTWPRRWSGEEPRGDELIPQVQRDGSTQHWLFGG